MNIHMTTFVRFHNMDKYFCAYLRSAAINAL